MSGAIEPSRATFLEAEQPLMRIEEMLKPMAQTWGAQLQVNYHGKPGRDIILNEPGGICRKLEIGMVFKDVVKAWQTGNYEYVLTLHAWKDVGSRRLSWSQGVGRFSVWPSPQELEKIVRTGWRTLCSVTEGDLKVNP